VFRIVLAENIPLTDNDTELSPPPVLSNCQRTFLTETTGRSFENSEHQDEAAFYAAFLTGEMSKFPAQLLNDCLVHREQIDRTTALFTLFTLIARLLKTNQFVTVDELVQKAIGEDLLVPGCAKQSNAQESARQIIVATVGRITMLYGVQFSGPNDPKNHFGLNAEQQRVLPVRLHSDEVAPRPVLEVLNFFHDLLPTRSEEKVRKPTHVRLEVATNLPPPDALTVSCLNAATLCQLAGIEIHWVKCISSHLDFDPVNRRLGLCCVPSFCRMNNSEEAVLSR
jgi:hypothetical protein